MPIYTLTFNPALDLGGTVARVVANEKNYVTSETRFAGGNGVNAARIMRRLGVPVVASGYLGGAVGEEYKRLLDREEIRRKFIDIEGDTRINLTISVAESHLQTRFSFPGPAINSREKRSLRELVAKIRASDLLVIGGSLPANFFATDVLPLVQDSTGRGVRVVADCPSPVLRALHRQKLLLVKPNLTEFRELTKSNAGDIESVAKVAKKLLKSVEFVCVSSVANGALLVTSEGIWHGRIPKINIKSSVGAGDSMVGAMTAFLWRRKVQTLNSSDFKKFKIEHSAELLRWGLAAACATLVCPGTAQGSKKNIYKYFDDISVRPVNRRRLAKKMCSSRGLKSPN